MEIRTWRQSLSEPPTSGCNCFRDVNASSSLHGFDKMLYEEAFATSLGEIRWTRKHWPDQCQRLQNHRDKNCKPRIAPRRRRRDPFRRCVFEWTSRHIERNCRQDDGKDHEKLCRRRGDGKEPQNGRQRGENTSHDRKRRQSECRYAAKGKSRTRKAGKHIKRREAEHISEDGDSSQLDCVKHCKLPAAKCPCRRAKQCASADCGNREVHCRPQVPCRFQFAYDLSSISQKSGNAIGSAIVVVLCFLVHR